MVLGLRAVPGKFALAAGERGGGGLPVQRRVDGARRGRVRAVCSEHVQGRGWKRNMQSMSFKHFARAQTS